MHYSVINSTHRRNVVLKYEVLLYWFFILKMLVSDQMKGSLESELPFKL